MYTGNINRSAVSYNDFGAIGIALGLLLVVYSDKKRRADSAKIPPFNGLKS